MTALVAIAELTWVRGTIVYSPNTPATDASGSGANVFSIETLSTPKPVAQLPLPPSFILNAIQT